MPLLASLLSLPHPEEAPPIMLSPQKQKTQEALVAWLVEEAERAAVSCTWEDLHWADPSTLEVLTLFLDQVPTMRMLALLTFRPEFSPPWGNRSYISQMMLSRLVRSQVEAMVEQMTGGKTFPSEVVQQIVGKTDGVPLFVEELTKTVIESVGSVESIGSGRTLGQLSLQLGIPATLHDALMARLDRLGLAKEIAQLGATIGREFSYELIHAVSPLDEGRLQQGLKQLVEAELLYQRGVTPQATYFFKHALIQDTVYQSLLKGRRQQLHQQIAHVLEERFLDTKETQPELLAHHYTEAGLTAQAIPYWQSAGQRAVARSANVEATASLTKGLELLKTLPDTPERTQQELTLQIALVLSLAVTKGQAAPEVASVYTRARELCRQVGETPELFSVLWGLFRFHFGRAEFRIARELGKQLLRLAQSVQDSALLIEAHRALGATLYFLGELVSALAHEEQGIALYDPQQHRSHALLYGQDPGVACLSWAAWALLSLGYPDQALKRVHEALTLAQELSHPLSLAFALQFASTLHLRRGEGQASQERAEAVIVLSTKQGFPQWLAVGTFQRGCALSEQGQREERIAQMRQGLAAFRATGAELERTNHLAVLAKAYGKVGQVEEGLTVLAEALAQANKTEERYWEAELYRLKGELTLQKFQVQGSKFQVTNPQSPTPNPQTEAEACFLNAIEIARRQQAKSLELRATGSLARLWQQQGKKDEARQLLAEIYGWVTEGFDTKDLQEAKALLGELTRD